MDYKKLAEKIKRAGKEIAADHIAKDYLIERTYRNTIIVTSDSGFEAIVVGDFDKCYVHIYHKCSDRSNTYPSAKKIEKLLQDVAEEKILDCGEGKAMYHYCDMVSEKIQRKYFADIVKRIADYANRE